MISLNLSADRLEGSHTVFQYGALQCSMPDGRPYQIDRMAEDFLKASA